MSISVGIVSLGCSKNQVDGEMLMAALQQDGFTLVEEAGLADVAIINTCGFIESAKKESIEEILELANLKKSGKIKKIVVTGCLAERYREEIHNELPEVDAVVGIGGNANIAALLKDMMVDEFTESFPPKTEMPLCGARVLSTPPYTAYIKIAEGCDNNCTYCTIPSIRGSYRSRTIENIYEEAEKLAKSGVRELVLIAQDTTRYGSDLYSRYSLDRLLKKLCEIEGLIWIRTLYCYPEAITEGLLKVLSEEEKLVKYLDIPIQHVSEKILKKMNRSGNFEKLAAQMQAIREQVPGVILRTTLITGFPGETEEDFTELAEFVKLVKFDRLGCFEYSREEGTPAAKFADQIEEEVKERRAEVIMQSQMEIMEQKGNEWIGRRVRVLVEGFDRFAGCHYGRSYMDAPDIDGKIFFTADKKPKPGTFVDVLVESCMDCDLIGKLVPITLKSADIL